MKWPSSSDQSGKWTFFHSPPNGLKQHPDGIVTSSFSRDVESVAFAVLLFLAAGIVLFISCFFVTKCLQCYKARQRRLRRKALGEDDDDDDEDDDEIDIDEDEPQTALTNSNPDLVKV